MDGNVLAGAKAPEELRRLGITRVALRRIQGATNLERICNSMLDAGRMPVSVPSPVEWVERHLGRLVKGKLKFAMLPFAEPGMNLDKLADREVLREQLDPWDKPGVGAEQPGGPAARLQ